jgi:hypothetical protein
MGAPVENVGSISRFLAERYVPVLSTDALEAQVDRDRTEIAHGEREAKKPGPAERAFTSQPAGLTSHEAHSAPDSSRAI